MRLHGHRAGARLLAALACAALAGCSPAPASPSGAGATASPAPSPEAAGAVDVSSGLSALEDEYDARVGVSAVDTGSGRTAAYRADERFGYASTLKAFAAAELLRRLPAPDRDAVVTWTREDLDAAGYSPVTAEHLDGGLTLAALGEAAVRDSDNTAMNLVLDRLGGPAALDAALEALGDVSTEVVHPEPELNTIEPGSSDDTSTPRAFTGNLRALAVDDVALAAGDREILLDWMSDNPTGDRLVRAGAPADWRVADKSGGAGPIRNDIAVVTPPGRAPIVLTVFTTRIDADAGYDDRLVAEAAAVVLTALAG